jgi:hypothetical protein
MKLVALIAFPLIAVGTAPVVHADVQAFNNDTQGVWMDPNAKVAAGYRVCTDMRAGMPYDAALHDGFAMLNIANGANVAIVNAAQHDLCPDTLGR